MDYLCQHIANQNWRLVEIGRLVISCNEVKGLLSGSDQVRELGVGKTKALVVPKSMMVGEAVRFSRLALLTSFEAERYNADYLAELMGVNEVTHEGIDTERVFGRKSGECSVLLEGQALNKFDRIIFSQRLAKDLRKKSNVVAYSLGEGRYFCTNSSEFMEHYFDNYMNGKAQIEERVFK